MLEAIGMTGKQQRSMLRDEGIMYGILTILVSASAGSAIGYFLVETVAGPVSYTHLDVYKRQIPHHRWKDRKDRELRREKP